ncbi:dephospho-CoA kinase [Aerococcus kribbianus]|uniref:Dephospho-CoA kinase n=1 Tax=Aerococcus kribbianus TaxID=2999064 RepID=A0A9X3FWY8_9LACT|nr:MULTISPECIES: dephospho-CoA kinase [unclassified Aerococcus]MCZ0717764.1 dephospho-CoA kinase [Aerococcus sp. YH-aer221]MCZ0726052.1 dephospho-CoA kinase [Aerococcus sp. YH-aer222]
MTKIIGLSGGIATGKSTVSQYLREKGFDIIDADLIARQVVVPSSEGLTRLLAHFGPSVLTPDGQLDRQALGERIFNDDQARQDLNDMLHPLILGEIKAEIARLQAAQVAYIILDVPLLFESSQFRAICQQTLLIWLPEDLQIERLMARDNLTKVQAQARLAAQMPLEDKKKLADDVIDNSGSRQETYQQVDQWITRL